MNEKKWYLDRKRKVWDGASPIYSEVLDRFSRNPQEFYYEYPQNTPVSLRLIICEPHYLPTIDYKEYWEDDLPDGMDKLPEEILEAIKAFDKVIEAQGPIAWFPSEFAAEFPKGEFPE